MTASDPTFVLQAPAKVNLTLQILGKRADGYHELDGVMQKLDLCDTLKIQRAKSVGVSLSCPDSDLPEDESNLVFQAAVSFLHHTGFTAKCGVSIVLEKRIPIAAGLGGGSSDAGTLLCGLNRLFACKLDDEQLLGLAKPLGADVSFFVLPDIAMRAEGIGERLTRVDSLSDCSVLLVNPGFSVSTAWVYKNYSLTKTDKVSNLDGFCGSDGENEDGFVLCNDLESVTIDHYPEIEAIKNAMLTDGASGTLMSGSGPTVFGVFPDGSTSDVQKCADEMQRKYRAGVFVTRPLLTD